MATLNEILDTLPSNGNGGITAAILRQAFEEVWNKAIADGSTAGNIVTFTVDLEGTSVIQDSGILLSDITTDLSTVIEDTATNTSDISTLTTTVNGKQDALPANAPGVLVNNGTGSLSWQEVSVGITRPTPLYIGQMFFDVNLGGKPIWWNGTNWVDYTGSVV